MTFQIRETFCGLTDKRTNVSTNGRTFETHFIRSTQKSRSNNDGGCGRMQPLWVSGHLVSLHLTNELVEISQCYGQKSITINTVNYCYYYT